MQASLEPKNIMFTVDDVIAVGIPIVVTLNSSTVRYRAFVTNAPQQYDGLGTIRLFEAADIRVVLVRDEHLEWQWRRYQSGMYLLEDIRTSVYGHIDATDITSELWRRIELFSVPE